MSNSSDRSGGDFCCRILNRTAWRRSKLSDPVLQTFLFCIHIIDGWFGRDGTDLPLFLVGQHLNQLRFHGLFEVGIFPVLPCVQREEGTILCESFDLRKGRARNETHLFSEPPSPPATRPASYSSQQNCNPASRELPRWAFSSSRLRVILLRRRARPFCKGVGNRLGMGKVLPVRWSCVG